MVAQKQGLVLKATGSWYAVRLPDGQIVESRARGKIRLQGSRATNPIVVGDYVELSATQTTNKTTEWVIENVIPRRNYIIRRASNLSKETHIIAANLDLVVAVVNLVAPPTPLEFIDRLLATAQAYSIPALIIRSKCDKKEEHLAAQTTGFDEIYNGAGYRVLTTSTTSGEGINVLKKLISGKTTLFAGMSGVGKSSLLNAIHPPLKLRTGPISEFSLRGCHTTTFCEAYELPFEKNTYVIDSPGIKGFGVVDFKREEIAHFFPEIFALSANCRFSSCIHIKEPACAVRQALEEKRIAPSRYNSYISILLDDERKYR